LVRQAPRRVATLPDRDAPAVVRPYVIARERDQEKARQRQRRRALVLATMGIDLGPRLIHGVEVAR
jgi:hypothetical protein